MEWPQELLDIFDDPILADVKPKAPKPTPNDRQALKLVEITEWVEKNGREPQKTASDQAEKLLGIALSALREKGSPSLKQYDTLNLLNK